jgi:hypothetical protein
MCTCSPAFHPPDPLSHLPDPRCCPFSVVFGWPDVRLVFCFAAAGTHFWRCLDFGECCFSVSRIARKRAEVVHAHRLHDSPVGRIHGFVRRDSQLNINDDIITNSNTQATEGIFNTSLAKAYNPEQFGKQVACLYTYVTSLL